MDKKDTFVEGEGFIAGEKLNYRLALLFQINRIGSVPSKIRIKLAGKDDLDRETFMKLSKEAGADTLYETVLLFDEMLSPYKDSEYESEKEALEKIPQDKNKPDGEKKYAKLDNYLETNEYARKLFGILMKLMRRKNLLLQEEGVDSV